MKTILEYIKHRDKQTYGIDYDSTGIIAALEDRDYKQVTRKPYYSLADSLSETDSKTYIVEHYTRSGEIAAIFAYNPKPVTWKEMFLGIWYGKSGKILDCSTGSLTGDDTIRWFNKRGPEMEYINNFLKQ